MGVQLRREKQRNLLVSILYKLHNLVPLSSKRKFKLYLDLEWIFDRLAHEMSFLHYSPSDHPARIFSKKFILSQITKDHRVLDLGCSTGVISNYISEAANKVVGIDLNRKSIEKAKSTFKRNNLTFVCDEAESFLSGCEEKFDVLILSHIIEHIDNPLEFLNRFKNQFNLIYIEVPDFDRYYLNRYRVELSNSLIYSDSDHVSEFDRKDLQHLLNQSGLSIIKEEYKYGVQKIWCKSSQ